MLQRYRHGYLLASLLLLLFIYPFMGRDGLGTALMDMALVLTMVTSILACSVNLRQSIVGLVLIALMQLVFLYRYGNDDAGLIGVYPGIGLLVFSYVTFLMLRKIFLATPRVTADTIYGALSIYMMLGILWTFAYTLLEIREPGSFDFGESITAPRFDRFMGFSFVTITTLGYGNVVPTNPRADALSAAEAVVGQVYLTVMLARLVALQLTQAGRSGGDDASA